jgi:hypothetical protein
MYPYEMRKHHLEVVNQLDEDENQWDAYSPNVIKQRCQAGFWIGIVALREACAAPEAFCFFVPTKNVVKVTRICGSLVGKRVLIERLQERYFSSKIELFVSEHNVLWCKELASLGFRSKLVKGLPGFDGLDAVQFTWRKVSLIKRK